MARRVSLKVLQKKARASLERTQEVQKEVTEKRSKRRSKKAKVEEERGETPNFGKPQTEKSAGQTQKDVVNWFHVHEWFHEGILRNNRDWLFEAKVPYRDKRQRESQSAQCGVLGWCEPEKNCARRLLKHYGAETVEKTVAWYCDNWQAMKDKSEKLQGAPSVRLLWSQRERFFAQAKEGWKPKVKKHMVGEYDAESANKLPLVGWGNEDDV